MGAAKDTAKGQRLVVCEVTTGVFNIQEHVASQGAQDYYVQVHYSMRTISAITHFAKYLVFTFGPRLLPLSGKGHYIQCKTSVKL